MKLILLAAGLAAASLAVPASAQSTPSNGIVYTVTAKSGTQLTAACTIVADRWTADYGPTMVYAVASSPAAISTSIRCTVTKGGTTWVDASRTASSDLVVINGERHGTIPVAGIQVCVDAVSQLTVDARPVAHGCISG